MNLNYELKLLFVVNPGSGPDDIDWKSVITDFFNGKPFVLTFFMLGKIPDKAALKNYISKSNPDRIIAVGGDGTVSLVAKIAAANKIPLGILPAGSANGMAKELKIPDDTKGALQIIEKGNFKKCDAITINGTDICLHLSDIGINARLIKYFDEGKLRGKLGYAKVLFKALWHEQKMQVIIENKNAELRRNAFMVVLANASKYGTGAVINPEGKLDDGLFEVVIVRRLALSEFFKMLIKPQPFNPRKIEIFSATFIRIETRQRVHFQIDGEFKGKVKNLTARILPKYIDFIMP